MDAPPTDPAGPPRPLSTRRGVLVAWVALAGTLLLGVLAERAWFRRDLPLAAPDPVVDAAADRPSPFLLVVVDGLAEQAVPSMPGLAALARRGASGVTIVGDPSMSAPCVRAIVSGRRPDLYASFRNFDPLPVRGSVPDLLAERGLRVGHAGDALLPRLCPGAYAPEDVFALPRELLRGARDLDDRAFPIALEKAGDPELDALTVHLVAVDLTGHQQGADGDAYARIVAETDARVHRLVRTFRQVRPDAHVLVVADHGLSPRGTHGGGEPAARRAPFVLAGPRVPQRAGVEIPQEALASTLAVLLHLPPPALAEVPPAFALVRLRTDERRAAVDAFARARIAALAAAGRALDARALEEARRATEGEGTGRMAEASLFATLLAMDAPGTGPASGALAAAALLVGLLVLLAGGGPARAAIAVAGLLGLLCVAAAGLALQRTFLATARLPTLATRGIGAALAVAGVAWWAARRVRGDRGPASIVGADVGADGGVAVAAGVALAALRSMRLPIDGVVHLPILIGALAGVAAVVAARRVAPRASARVRWAFPAAVLVFVAATRALEGVLGETWLAVGVRGAVGSAVTLGAAVGVAAIAARLPARSTGAVVVLVLIGDVVAFHALGGAESLGRLDPRHAFVPGDAGDAPAQSFATGLVGPFARHAFVAGALLLAARRSLARGGGVGRLGAVIGGLALAFAAGAAALVVGAAVWSRWSWWMVVAHPVFLLALVDLAALAVAGTAVAALDARACRGDGRTPGGPRPIDGYDRATR